MTKITIIKRNEEESENSCRYVRLVFGFKKKDLNEGGKKIQAFDDLVLTQIDFEKAAEFSNECRRNGTQGSHIDFLICAAVYNNKLRIFTTDKDFSNYGKILQIELHNAREENIEVGNKEETP